LGGNAPLVQGTVPVAPDRQLRGCPTQGLACFDRKISTISLLQRFRAFKGLQPDGWEIS
jgi:hypothetical protein